MFASQNYQVKEDTAADAYLGFNLNQALKIKFSGRLTDQEVYMMEMKLLNAKCDKSVQCPLCNMFKLTDLISLARLKQVLLTR